MCTHACMQARTHTHTTHITNTHIPHRLQTPTHTQHATHTHTHTLSLPLSAPSSFSFFFCWKLVAVSFPQYVLILTGKIPEIIGQCELCIALISSLTITKTRLAQRASSFQSLPAWRFFCPSQVTGWMCFYSPASTCRRMPTKTEPLTSSNQLPASSFWMSVMLNRLTSSPARLGNTCSTLVVRWNVLSWYKKGTPS